jgi:hypothetical protein
MSEYGYVETDDWRGLYKDGKIILQGHSWSVHDWLDELGVPLENRFSWEDNAGIDQMFEDTGHCPDTWDEVLEWAKK